MATKIQFSNFAMYGLNRYRNLLKAPICDCGCGNKMYVPLEDEADVIDFCCSVLMESDCKNPGMFAVFKDGTYAAFAIMRDEDEDNEDADPKFAMVRGKDMHLFSEFDADFCLHCYGMICEIRPGYWKIME